MVLSFSKSYFQVPREFSGVYVVMWAYCTTSLFHEPELEDFRGIPPGRFRRFPGIQ